MWNEELCLIKCEISEINELKNIRLKFGVAIRDEDLNYFSFMSPLFISESMILDPRLLSSPFQG